MKIDALKEILLNLKRTCQIVSFVARTEFTRWKPLKDCPNKKNPYKKRVKKLSYLNGMLGAQYGSCVERVAKRAGIDNPPPIQPRKWGERVKGTPLVKHKDQYYLEYLPIRKLQEQFILDNRPATPEEMEDIKQYMKENEPPPKGVVWRNYRLDHLESIKVEGNPIEVE